MIILHFLVFTLDCIPCQLNLHSFTTLSSRVSVNIYLMLISDQTKQCVCVVTTDYWHFYIFFPLLSAAQFRGGCVRYSKTLVTSVVRQPSPDYTFVFHRLYLLNYVFDKLVYSHFTKWTSDCQHLELCQLETMTIFWWMKTDNLSITVSTFNN